MKMETENIKICGSQINAYREIYSTTVDMKSLKSMNYSSALRNKAKAVMGW